VPIDRLIAIFSSFLGDKTHGSLARAIVEILSGNPDEVAKLVEAYLVGYKDRDKLIRDATTMLGILIGSSRPPALNVILDSIVANTDAEFTIELIATGSLRDTHLHLRQAVCDCAWIRSAALKDSRIRQRVRSKILNLMPDKTAIFRIEILNLASFRKDKEVGTQPVDLFQLIEVGAQHPFSATVQRSPKCHLL
jgi:hypothetical protein